MQLKAFPHTYFFIVRKLKMESLGDLQWPDSNFPYVKILDDEPPVVCPKPVYAKIPPKPAGDGTGFTGIFPMKLLTRDKDKEKHHSTSDSTQTPSGLNKRRKDEDALDSPETEFDIGPYKGIPRKNTFQIDHKRNDGPEDAASSQKLDKSKSAKSVKFEDCFRIPGLHKKHAGKEEEGADKEEEYTTVIEQTKKVTQTSAGSNKVVETKKVTQTSTGSHKENRTSQNNTSAVKDSMTGPTHEDVGSTGSEEAQDKVVRRTLTGSINNIKKTLGSLRSSFKKTNPDQSETALIEDPQQTVENPYVNQAHDDTFFDTDHNREEPFQMDGAQTETQYGGTGMEGGNFQDEPQAKLSGGRATKEALTNIPVKGGRFSSAGQVGPRPQSEVRKKTDENVQADVVPREEGRQSNQSRQRHESMKRKTDENVQADVAPWEGGRQSNQSRHKSESMKRKTDENVQADVAPWEGGRQSNQSRHKSESMKRKTDENVQADVAPWEGGRQSNQSRHRHESMKRKTDENVQADVAPWEGGRQSNQSRHRHESMKKKTDENVQVENQEAGKEKKYSKHSHSKTKHSKDENAQAEREADGEGQKEGRKGSKHKHSRDKDEDVQAEADDIRDVSSEKKHSKAKYENPKRISKEENTQAETAAETGWKEKKHTKISGDENIQDDYVVPEDEEGTYDKHSRHKHEKTEHKKHHRSHKHRSKEMKHDHENDHDLDEPKPQTEKVSVEEMVNGVSMGKAEVSLTDMPEQPFPKKRVSKSIVEVVIHSQRPSAVSIHETQK